MIQDDFQKYVGRKNLTLLALERFFYNPQNQHIFLKSGTERVMNDKILYG